MLTRAERITGGLIGLLVGDALGVPYEFHMSEQIPPVEQIEFDPPPTFPRAHAGTPPGTWSDDGAQALCLLDSLLACRGFDADDLGQRLLRWYDEDYLAVDGRVFDIGIQTGRALQALRRGVPALSAGSTEESALGNGSLMRVLPLALWHTGSDADLVASAQSQSRITHGHLRAQVCCALYCHWARCTLENADDAWGQAVATLRNLFSEASPEHAELEWFIRPDEPSEGKGGGYVVDCLRSARMVMAAGNYEAVVKSAIALGNDTDTTACVAGGIAGIRDGITAIPARWQTSLRGRNLYEPLLNRLLAFS